MPVIENKKIAFTQADLDAVKLAPKVQAMLDHNRSLIGPNRNSHATFTDGRVCTHCHIWKPWKAYYPSSYSASGYMNRCIRCNSRDCHYRYTDRK